MSNNEYLLVTPSQTAGPFFHLGCTEKYSVGSIAGPNAKGERVRMTCRVFDGDNTPVCDCMIEIWQADADGNYNVTDDGQTNKCDPYCGGFGRLATNKDGACIFETIKPGRAAGPEGKLQAPHLNVSVFARGILKRLVTRIYFADDPANLEDPVLALVPEERRKTLIALPDPETRGDLNFDIHLCGSYETVFFDI